MMAITTSQMWRQHTEGTQSVIDGDQNNILIHEMMWSVKIHFSATAAHEPAAAVNEKHYRP
jgi:hypothetical protein